MDQNKVVDDQSVAPLHTSSIKTYGETLGLFLQSKGHATEANKEQDLQAELQASIVNNSLTQDNQLYFSHFFQNKENCCL